VARLTWSLIYSLLTKMAIDFVRPGLSVIIETQYSREDSEYPSSVPS
jgi:hypothetical protein